VHHSHNDAHATGIRHSHHPGPCHKAGHTNSVPPAEDHGPCQCSAQNTLVAPLPHIEKIESSERSLDHGRNPFATSAGAIGIGPVFRMTHGPPIGSGNNPLSCFQGNPCALLCRWLI
jgi:hypothetical protein